MTKLQNLLTGLFPSSMRPRRPEFSGIGIFSWPPQPVRFYIYLCHISDICKLVAGIIPYPIWCIGRVQRASIDSKRQLVSFRNRYSWESPGAYTAIRAFSSEHRFRVINSIITAMLSEVYDHSSPIWTPHCSDTPWATASPFDNRADEQTATGAEKRAKMDLNMKMLCLQRINKNKLFAPWHRCCCHLVLSIRKRRWTILRTCIRL